MADSSRPVIKYGVKHLRFKEEKVSGYRLCQNKKAENPYFIENVSTNIFSIEELCYYMYHNPALLDATFVNQNLTDWVGTELGLVRLASAMNRALTENESLSGFVLPAFREISYLTYEEIKEYTALLEKLAHASVPVRIKMKGDALVRCGKHFGAIDAYRLAIEEARTSVKDTVFLSSLWHNKGTAEMKMMLYGEGLASFEKALLLDDTKENRMTYLTALLITRPSGKAEEEISRRSFDPGLVSEAEEKIRLIRQSDEGEVPDHPDEYLAGLTQQYHNATGT